MVKCDACGAEMRLGRKFMSGNSKYAELVCTSCFNRKVTCEGVKV